MVSPGNPATARDVWGVDNGVYLGYPVNNTEGVPDAPTVKPLQYAGDRHIVTLGPNGSGKSRRLLLSNLIALRGWSCLVIDPKGELAWQTAGYRSRCGQVVILNPYKVMGLPNHGFNPVTALDPASPDFVDDALALAEAMIQVEGAEPHWSASAQDLVTALLLYVRLKRGAKAALRQVRELLGQPALQFHKTVEDMQRVGIAEDWEELTIKAARFLDINPENRELNSILSTAMTQTRWLDSRPIKDSTDTGAYDFAEMKRRPTTIYLILPANRLGTMAPWLRLVITSALNRLMKDIADSRVPVLLALDEMAQLGYLPSVDRQQALFRGYGIKLWSVLQDMNQARAIYRDRWESFIANAGVLQAFASQDVTTAEYLSRRSGQTTHMLMSFSGGIDRRTGQMQGESVSVAPTPLPGMMPQELMNMDMGYSVLFTHRTKGVVRSYMPDPSEMDMMRPHIRPLP